MLSKYDILKKSVIYEVFLRNYPPYGNFKSLIADLDRISDFGIDIIWLMPFYPCGKKNRKGEFGSPYAIYDYKGIDSTIGNFDDFDLFIKECRKRDIKVIIDIVFHHTACDSVIVQEHGDFILKDKDGSFTRKVPDWSDVYDLDFSNDKLYEYLIDVLRFWLEKGVNGFRCDVAPAIPLRFWQEANDILSKDFPDIIWLAESTEPDFIYEYRQQGYNIHSDCELYNVFDITYDYDIWRYFKQSFNDLSYLDDLVNALRNQLVIYPKYFLKLRFLENHDQVRVASIIKNEKLLKLWTAFLFSLPGPVLIYNGQEYFDSFTLSLFDRQIMKFNKDKNVSQFFKNLIFYRKELQYDNFDIFIKDNVILCNYNNGMQWAAFNFSTEPKFLNNLFENVKISKNLLQLKPFNYIYIV